MNNKLTRRIRRIVIMAALGVAVVLVAVSRLGGTGTSTDSPDTASSDSAYTNLATPPASTPASTAAAASSRPAPAGKTTTTPAAGDGDDGADDPILVQPTANPDAREAALTFAAAWLNTYHQDPQAWRDSLTPRVTPDIAEALANADPASVPTGGRATTAKMSAAGAVTTADITVVADGTKQTLGTLTLDLIQQGRAWLVNDIDWTGR